MIFHPNPPTCHVSRQSVSSISKSHHVSRLAHMNLGFRSLPLVPQVSMNAPQAAQQAEKKTKKQMHKKKHQKKHKNEKKEKEEEERMEKEGNIRNNKSKNDIIRPQERQ